MLSQKETSILKSPVFQDALRKSFEALDEKYVPIRARKILSDGLSMLLKTCPESDTRVLSSLLAKLYCSTIYISKTERDGMKKDLWRFIVQLSPENISIPLIEDFRNEPSANCFYGLTYDGIAPDLMETLCLSKAHTWNVSEANQKLKVEGELGKKQFEILFMQHWDKKLLSKYYSAEHVLEIVSYITSPVATIVEDSFMDH